MNLQSLLHCPINIVFYGISAEEYLDGERAAGNVKDGNVTEERRELIRVHRRRGNDQLEVFTPRNYLPCTIGDSMNVTRFQQTTQTQSSVTAVGLKKS